jgi:tetrapyrrole methylase family protein/MazG family protein
VVVGLGPGDPGLLTVATRAAIDAAPRRYLRTSRHPTAAAVPDAVSFDAVYDAADRLADVYAAIAATLADVALEHGSVLYAVPGSPLVAEHTVELLRTDARIEVEVLPAMSFVDLAWDRLGVDPVAAGARLVDGHRFEVEAAGSTGPLLVAQCDTRDVLSAVKLAVGTDPATGPGPVTVLQRLGLPDEAVFTVAWDDLDRDVDADHLTSLWIPTLAAPVAGEVVALVELVRTLRARCPWDRVQTHRSLARHLLEETYELLDAIDGLPAAGAPGTGDAAVGDPEVGDPEVGDPEVGDPEVGDPEVGDAVVVVDGGAEEAWEHLEEELGDVLFQVAFHAVLGSEAGRFGLADVARGIHDKLVARHPHVFGPDAVIPDAGVSGPPGSQGRPAEVADLAIGWEQRKKREKGRDSVMDGIPPTLPSLLYADKVQRKAGALGLDWPDADGVWAKVTEELDELRAAVGGDPVGGTAGEGAAGAEVAGELGDVLFTVVNLGRKLGVDPEMALRGATARFRRRVQAVERRAAADGVEVAAVPVAVLDGWWEQAKAGD